MSVVSLFNVGLIFLIGINFGGVHSKLSGPVRTNLGAFVAGCARIINLDEKHNASFVSHGVPLVLRIGVNNGVVVRRILPNIRSQVQKDLILHAFIIAAGVTGGRLAVDVGIVSGGHLEIKLLIEIHRM